MTTLTPPNQAISDVAVNQFLRDGFIRVDDVIEDSDLAWYRQRYDEIFDPGSTQFRRKKLGSTDEQGRDALPQVQGPSNQMPELLDRPYLKRIEAIAKAILGPEAQFRNDHMIFKPAGYGVATPWHQDQAYHDPTLHYTNINFWLPLEDVTEEGGCMQYVRNTHRGTVVPHEWLNGDDNAAMVAQDQDYWMRNATALPCPAGSVCLHHSYCMHYAAANTTAVPRRAYIVVFVLPPTKLEQPFDFPWRDAAKAV